MRYVFNTFTLEPEESVQVRGSNSLYSLQNTSSIDAILQGSNTSTEWVNIVTVASNTASTVQCAFKYLKVLNTSLRVNRADNTKDSETNAAASAQEAAASAASASEILTTTMRKITVNTDDDIPAFASLLSDYIIKVKSSTRNGGFSTTYYFDFDNQFLSWIPTVGV